VSVEVIERAGTTYAEVIRSGVELEETRFFSPAESSFQLGLLAHKAGFHEPPHVHAPAVRTIRDLQQMFVMQRGVVDVDFCADDGSVFRTIRLNPGDAIVLVHGAHAIRVIEDFQAVSVKQGPFLGDEHDKILLGDAGSLP
jgi:hypothetical protein